MPNKTCETPPLLLAFLEPAVAVACFGLQQRGGPSEGDIERARAWGEKLPEVADLLVRSSPGAGAVLSETARSLAVLLWVMPEGQSIDFLGVQWSRQGLSGESST